MSDTKIQTLIDHGYIVDEDGYVIPKFKNGDYVKVKGRPEIQGRIVAHSTSPTEFDKKKRAQLFTKASPAVYSIHRVYDSARPLSKWVGEGHYLIEIQEHMLVKTAEKDKAEFDTYVQKSSLSGWIF